MRQQSPPETPYIPASFPPLLRAASRRRGDRATYIALVAAVVLLSRSAARFRRNRRAFACGFLPMQRDFTCRYPVQNQLRTYLAAGLLTGGGAAGVQTFATVFLGIFFEAVPFVLIGAGVSALLGVFVRDATVMRWLPQGRMTGPLAGSLLGLVFPVCECGVVPVVRRLLNKGAATGLGVAFLLAAPVMNPVVLWSTWAAFGGDWRMVGARAGLTLAIATIVGVVFAFHPNPHVLLKSAPVGTGYTPAVLGEYVRGGGRSGGVRLSLGTQREAETATLMQKLRAACDHAAAEFFEMGKFLVIGAALAAALQTAVPRGPLVAAGQSPVAGVLVMLALAVLLSVCSTVDAFVVLTFAGSFTTGAVLAFLVFGPMVDIKSTLMFLTVFERRAVALMIALVLALVLLATLTINLNIA